MLEFKDDWDRAKERLAAWYRCEVVDRCVVAVTAPRDGVRPAPPTPPPTLEERWTNVDYRFEAAEEKMRRTFYGGEAAPLFRAELGPNVFSAWLGCPLVFGETTTWTKPVLHDWDAFEGLHFDRDHRWWRWLRRVTRQAAERGRGRYLVGVPDIHGGGDALAALRGTKNFCMDLLLRPDRVAACEAFVRRMWFEVAEVFLADSTSCGQEGTAGFLGWGPGRTVPLQEDLLALISPALFERFFLQAIVEQTEYLDSSVFHLDGPESLPHLDRLLDLPRLHGIQWQPGAAHYPITRWIPLIRRIQQAGKCVLFSAQPHEIETLLAELPAAGLQIWTHCRTEQEARQLLKDVARWSR